MKNPRPACKNCGDPTTFSVCGDRSPDYERETLGWCRRCWKLASKDKDWEKNYAVLREQLLKRQNVKP